MMNLENLKRDIFTLLKEDEEFRHAVAGLIGYEELLEGQREIRRELKELKEEQVRLREEMKELREEMNELRREQVRLREEMSSLREEQIKLQQEQVRLREEMKEIKEEQIRLREEMNSLKEQQIRLQEEQVRLREEMKEIREEQIRLREDFAVMNRKLDALGARWGIMSEGAFRETLKGLLEKNFAAKVEKWVYNDEKGEVFGYPAVVDIDVVITDGKVIVVEVKSHFSQADIAILHRKAQFYKKITGAKVDEVIASSPYFDDRAKEACSRLGVTPYTLQ